MLRRKIWKIMHERKVNICLLQETHSCTEDQPFWSNEWEHKILFAHGDKNARGVAILVDKKFSTSIQEVNSDPEGRFLMIKLDINNYSHCIANIYAPNADDPGFFRKICQVIKSMDCVYNIIGGDFMYNIDLNPDLDWNDMKSYKGNTREVLNEIMEEEEWVDIWRILHPQTRCFTWVKTRPKITWSRIDFFLVSSNLTNLTNLTEESEIFSCIHLDHNGVELVFSNSVGKEDLVPGNSMRNCY